jgi:hypothetical protein
MPCVKGFVTLLTLSAFSDYNWCVCVTVSEPNTMLIAWRGVSVTHHQLQGNFTQSKIPDPVPFKTFTIQTRFMC